MFWKKCLGYKTGCSAKQYKKSKGLRPRSREADQKVDAKPHCERLELDAPHKLGDWNGNFSEVPSHKVRKKWLMSTDTLTGHKRPKLAK